MKTRFLILILLVGISIPEHGQTNTNISDSLRWQYDSITWGPATNGIQLGVVRASQTPPHAPRKFPVIVYLCNTNASPYYGLLPVPEGHRLDLSLLDSAGKPVERTRAGDAKCKSITTTVKARLESQRKAIILPPWTPYQYDKFDLLECFKIEKPGTNTLTVRAKLYKLASYPNIEPVVLPEVSIKLILTDSDLAKR